MAVHRKGVFVKAREIEARCWELKRDGLRSSEIGKKLGISPATASAAIRRVNARLQGLTDGEAEVERAALLERLDQKIARLRKAEDYYYAIWFVASETGVSATDEEAEAALSRYQEIQETLLKVEEARRKLLNLDLAAKSDTQVGPPTVNIVMVPVDGRKQLDPQITQAPCPQLPSPTIVEVTADSE